MPFASSTYRQGQHSPCQHFAQLAYAHLLSALPDDVLSSQPGDDIGDDMDDDDDPGSQDRWRDRFVLTVIQGEASVRRRRSRKTRKASDDGEGREKPLVLAGVRIDWHLSMPELKIWAGQASLETLISGRQAVLRDANGIPDGVRLLDWSLPYPTMSGLDPRTAASALDIGFSPAMVGMPVMTFVAAELQAVVGMQLSPITRFGRREYGYQDDIGQWWQFSVQDRGGKHRMLSMAVPRR